MRTVPAVARRASRLRSPRSARTTTRSQQRIPVMRMFVMDLVQSDRRSAVVVSLEPAAGGFENNPVTSLAGSALLS